MKIFVNATANDSRGAFTVAKDFLEEINNNLNYLKKNNITLCMLVSNETLLDYSNKNIVVKLDSTPKKSFIHKFYYEYYLIPKLLKKDDFDAFLSLQNTAIRKGKYKQIVLIHNPLPFDDLKVGDLEIKNYLKYKVVLNFILKMQYRRIDKIIVQTGWMARAIKNKGYKGEVKVIRPESNNLIDLGLSLNGELNEMIISDRRIKLFYPTNVEKYKNNDRLIDAVESYNYGKPVEKQVTLYLTLDGNNTESVKFIGKVDYSLMYSLYKSMNALIFPSLTETLGLPLLESDVLSLPKIVSDRDYAREICGENAYYFNPLSIESMKSILDSFVSDFVANKVKNNQLNNEYKSSTYFEYIKLIQFN